MSRPKLSSLSFPFSFPQPAISIGNVGQLAMDLVLSNVEVEYIGALDHSALLPVAGADPEIKAKDNLMTAGQGLLMAS